MISQTFNYHTHTYRCGHAIGSDEEYVEAAIKSGYQILGFSDHIQHRAMNGKLNRINYEEFDEYFESIHRLKKKYHSDIEILCGLEAAFIPEWLEDLYDIREKCDYFILGQHVGAPDDLQYNRKCSEEDVLHYALDIEYGIRTGLYSIIAHPDYFMVSRDAWNENCIKATKQICSISTAKNIPLEINLKGFSTPYKKINDKLVHPYPFRKFWEIVSDYNCPVIWGIDAHSPEALCDDSLYKKSKELLKGIPLNIQKNFYPKSTRKDKI